MKRTADDYAVLLRLLDEVLDLPVEARTDWVDRLSGPAAQLQPTLRRLLLVSSAPETADILGLRGQVAEAVRQAVSQPEPHELEAGEHIGPYELVREIGRGGMGLVWLANRADGAFRRSVALKLPYVTWSGNAGERMARERDILAALEHPNIARFYDAGIDAFGRPFMAMEYVEGQSIDAYSRDRRLSIRQQLALILDVAKAVAFAHSKLVIHRDLKPANMLVTAEGAVRLLDFGIAKLVESDSDGSDARVTQLTGRMLTPDYASPEQILGQSIGTATDVYSLAVVAYELLAGTRPYRLKRNSAAELADAIAGAEPRLVSDAADDRHRSRQLRGDLDAVLNKAMKKEAAERYATVDAFAEDVQRYLEGKPVFARPDGAWYRCRKFVARHRLPVGAAAVLIVVVLAGSGAALWQAHQARAEAMRADQVKDFLLSIFGDADTDSGAGAATTAADLLIAAQARVATDLSTRPDVAVELMTSIGYGLIGQNRTDQAVVILGKAVQVADRELGMKHLRTLAAKVVYGEALQINGEPEAAVALLTPVVAEARRQHATHELVEGLRWLGNAESDLYEAAAAVAAEREAVNALPPAVTKADRFLAASAWGDLANVLLSAKQPGAVNAARNAVSFGQQVDGDRVSEATLSHRAVLGRALAREGQPARGVEELTMVVADAQRFLGPGHRKVRLFTGYLGAARLDAGDMQGAIEAFQLELGIAEKETNLDAEMARGVANYGIGLALSKARRGEEALPYFDVATTRTRTAFGADAPLALRSLSARALTLLQLGRVREADQAFQSLATARFAGSDREIHIGREAALRSAQGRHREAIVLAQEAVAKLPKTGSQIALADAHRILGCVLLAAGQAHDAIAPLREAVQLYEKNQIMVSPDRAEAIAVSTQAQAQSESRAVVRSTR
jgi:eukaryotic-like serine/threonine-protein kinase